MCPGAWNRSVQVPNWPAFLLKVQITTVYANTDLAKLNEQYLSDEIIGRHLRDRVPVPELFLPALAVWSIAADFILSVALWIPALRPVAFLIAASLHLGIVLMANTALPLLAFALMMLSGYALFVQDALLKRRAKQAIRSDLSVAAK